MSDLAHEKLEPVDAPLFTKPFIGLAVFAALALLMIPWRFFVGLGPATGLTDGYPWGLWKIINVVILTGVGSGGYVVALLVYGLNRESYHPIARLAIATSAVGYTSGVIALGIVDLGRPWNFWRLIDVTRWNLHSVLLEVGVCVSVYLLFLWMEMAPPVLERWRREGASGLKRWARIATPYLERWYPWIVAMAITLPTMHQSSLGSLFLLAGPRLHPLWQTKLLPFFFLLSAWFLGIAAVVLAAMLANLYWKRPLPMPILQGLMKINGVLVLVFYAVRYTDLAFKDRLGLVFAFDKFSFFFILEMLILLPVALVPLYARRPQEPGRLFRMALLVLLGGMLYRANVCLFGFMPGQGWDYFPSVSEIVLSAGLCALGVVAYLWMVKRLPIISNAPSAPVEGR